MGRLKPSSPLLSVPKLSPLTTAFLVCYLYCHTSDKQKWLCKNDCTWVCLYINKPSCAVTTPELTQERFCSFIPRVRFKSIVDWQEPIQWTHRKARAGTGWEQGCRFPPNSRKQYTPTMSCFCFTSQKKIQHRLLRDWQLPVQAAGLKTKLHLR